MRNEPVITVRNRIGRWGCWALTALAAVLLASQVVSTGPRSLGSSIGPTVLVLCAAWTLWGWPVLRLDPAQLLVANPFTTTRVPWAHLQAAESAWGLVLVVDGRRLRASAAPQRTGASTGIRRPPNRHEELLRAALPGTADPVSAPDRRAKILAATLQADRDLTLALDAASAVHLVTELRDRRLATSSPGPVRRTWRWERLALVVLGVAATALLTF